VICPRCGRPQPPADAPGAPRPGATRYCVHCGRVLTGVQWVALPPDAMAPREPRLRRRPYAGPPSYRAVPLWSLRSWMPAPAPAADGAPDPHGPLPPPARPDPGTALRGTAGLLRRLALTTAVLAGIAAVAEGWRYALLVASRSEALSPGPLAFSDALVTLVGLLAPATALATGVTFLWWLCRGREIAATISGTRPARRTWAVVVGSVVPGPNLTVPGSALAEVEHAASGMPANATPRPSVPVARWWAAWAVSIVLGIVAVLRGLGGSTQALADAVVLHGLADLAAAVTALLTVTVVAHLTELLAPELRTRSRAHVVRVTQGSQAPPSVALPPAAGGAVGS
jgi:hypothetical protein